MAEEEPRNRSPRRESDRSRRDDRDENRGRVERPRQRSRSPRRESDRDRDRERDYDRRDDRDSGKRNDRERESERPRREDRRGGGGGGFKWKQKRSGAADDREGGEKRLERGYRKRSRSPRRDRDRDRHTENNSKSSKSSAGNSVEDEFGVADKFGLSKSSSSNNKDSDDTSKPPERAAAAPTSAPSGEPMIIVNVNDRLGTKASIPCLASDPIRLFKAQVAARIGRQPHEILLKRQGERPFKDQLTLEDYGVSNGVQIDLEIDTGE